MDRLTTALGYMRRNGSLAVGIVLLLALALFVGIGHLVVDTSKSRPLSAPALRPPSVEHPFGTDRQGRDLLATMVAGTPLTLRIGFIAGFLGVGIGSVLGFVSAYYRGTVDTIIRSIVDIGLTVPGLLVLIIIAVSVKKGLTVDQMAIIVASLAWLNPARTIRAQVLSLRERGYVEVARLSGMSGPEIIVKELMPNLLPSPSSCPAWAPTRPRPQRPLQRAEGRVPPRATPARPLRAAARRGDGGGLRQLRPQGRRAVRRRRGIGFGKVHDDAEPLAGP